MVISSCQMIGYISGISTLVGSIVVTVLPDWKHNSIGGKQSFGTNIVHLKGLWSKCFVQPSGLVECMPLSDPFFALATVIRGCRVLVILATILSFIGVATTPLGMQCTRIGGDRFTKAKLARLGAFLFGISGILIGAAVSWFADDIAKEFHGKDPKPVSAFNSIKAEKYVYGNSLFVGWGTMVLGIISCLFLALGSFEKRVSPRVVTPSVYSNSSRLLAASKSNDKERSRPITPVKRIQKAKPSGYYSTAVLNGYPGAHAMTTLARSYPSRPGLVRQASTSSAPAKTTTSGNGPSTQDRYNKTYV